MRTFLPLISTLLVASQCFAQGEFNNWYFGAYTAITFNSGDPVLLTDNPVNSGGWILEVSVSDSNGNLLFFSGGIRVYNRNLTMMPNGDSLMGGTWSLGSAGELITVVPFINDKNKYYLFTVNNYYANDSIPIDGLRYSVLNMELNGGLGDIEPGMKNIPVLMGDSAVDQITSIRHHNNRDAWVVTKRHGLNGADYLAYLVTSEGIDMDPIVSPSSIHRPFYGFTGVGGCKDDHIRISPDGRFLISRDSLIEICRFNSSTGEVTPKFILQTNDSAVMGGFEFSIDSKYLYITMSQIQVGDSAQKNDYLFQYDMNNEDSLSFIQNRVLIGDSAGYSIQMAPDGKIYLNQTWDFQYLNRINFPSQPGLSCGYESRILQFPGPKWKNYYQSLPTFLQRYKAYVHHTIHCVGDSIRFTSDIWPPADSIHWDFGDPASGASNGSNLANPAHLFSGPRTYTIELWVRHIDLRTDTTWVTIAFPNPQLGPDRIACFGDSTTFDAGYCEGCTYLWRNLPGGDTLGTAQTYTATSPGTYEVAVTDTNYCTERDTVQFSLTDIPSVTNSPLSKTICSEDSTNIVLTSSVANTTFTWTATLLSGTVTGASADSGFIINQVLTNTGSTPGVVSYHITPHVGSCTGDTVSYLVTVNPGTPVSITIEASANNVCEGIPVTFTATPVNGGSSPTYQWKVNANNAGMNNTVFTYVPASGDQVSCILTSSIIDCPTNNPATSDTIILTVNPILPVSVSVAASQNPVCEGVPITFTATPVNGGSSPTYQWQVNENNAGMNNAVFTYVPASGDQVSCILTSNEACTSNNPDTSDAIILTVNPNLPVSVSVAASENPVCQGAPVTFTATPVNGGSSPTFQWQVNAGNAGMNNAVFTYVPSSGDQVSVILTSNETCTSNNPDTSDAIILTVNPNLPVSVSVAASQNPVCEGAPVTFTATSFNGGTSPAFQWQVNGTNAGTNSDVFTYYPASGDQVSIILTSNETCTSNNPATSDTLEMNVVEAPVVSLAACFDTITTTHAKPILLRGGIPLGGTYSGTGVTSSTGRTGGTSWTFDPAVAGAGVHEITYRYTNSAGCLDSAKLSILNSQFSILNCGDSLTDIRDNKKYPTVQIGSQCWMAAGLDYGTAISASSPQRDNCIAEKYMPPSSFVPRPSFYQWDELMQYQETESLQGLCPPEWHVPSEADWEILFANWTNNAFAGKPLLYTGFSGFNALLTGVQFFNRLWEFEDTATFLWSSTAHGPWKAWAHAMNQYNYSISYYPSYRINAFSVRCVRD